MVNLLLAKGANINAFDKKDRRALHWAAYIGKRAAAPGATSGATGALGRVGFLSDSPGVKHELQRGEDAACSERWSRCPSARGLFTLRGGGVKGGGCITGVFHFGWHKPTDRREPWQS